MIVMRYLRDYVESLDEQYMELFKNGALPEEESFYRDTERRQTLEDIINLDYIDMEAFYAETSMGQIDDSPE